jgi:hypothetical protein
VDPRIARRAAGTALLFGILAEILFDQQALGIGVPLATALVLATITMFSATRRPADRLDLWLPALALLASFGPALRTDPIVALLDMPLTLAAVSAWSFAVGGVAVTRRTATTVAALGAQAVIVVGTGLAWLIARGAADGALHRGGLYVGRIAPVLRGLLIAVPVLTGFTILLASADAVFGRAIDDAFHFQLDLDAVIGRGAFSIVAAVFVAGPLSIATGGAAVLARLTDMLGAVEGDVLAAESRPRAGRGFATEALVVLLAVDALFAVFATVQVVFLFGGTSTLAAIGMTYSDYARQGYFQLVGVVALAGLLLLGAHEVVGRTRPFQALAIALLVLTGVILASAALRLDLYQGAYGWTELRFFVAASIAWLAACVGIALGAIVLDRMRWLPHGIAMSAAAVTLVVSALGPQAFVMHQNLARVLDPSLVSPGGHPGLDLAYAISLGDDGIPDLVSALALVPAPERALLRAQLEERRAALEREAAEAGPLSWNLARERARSALAQLPEGQ